MTKMKSFIALLVSVLMAAMFVLSGCGSKAPTDNGSDKPSTTIQSNSVSPKPKGLPSNASIENSYIQAQPISLNDFNDFVSRKSPTGHTTIADTLIELRSKWKIQIENGELVIVTYADPGNADGEGDSYTGEGYLYFVDEQGSGNYHDGKVKTFSFKFDTKGSQPIKIHTNYKITRQNVGETDIYYDAAKS
jgi:hypothetical protein